MKCRKLQQKAFSIWFSFVNHHAEKQTTAIIMILLLKAIAANWNSLLFICLWPASYIRLWKHCLFLQALVAFFCKLEMAKYKRLIALLRELYLACCFWCKFFNCKHSVASWCKPWQAFWWKPVGKLFEASLRWLLDAGLGGFCVMHTCLAFLPAVVAQCLNHGSTWTSTQSRM